jgi:hypothetical protein
MRTPSEVATARADVRERRVRAEYRELMDAAVSTPHVDDTGAAVWPYVKGRHGTPCGLCDALDALGAADDRS